MQIMLPCLPFRCRAVSKEALGIMQRAGSFKVTLSDTPMFHCVTWACFTLDSCKKKNGGLKQRERFSTGKAYFPHKKQTDGSITLYKRLILKIPNPLFRHYKH